MLTDIEIAQQTKMTPITEIAASLGIREEELEPYGRFKAKLNDSLYNRLKDRKDGKLILVTAINPTPAGEGKTTTTAGLGEAMAKIGKNAVIALREPSLGPVFGVKGGAAGGGYAQVVPMEDINLHFTGDMHALTSANNLLCAMLDNHMQQGNELRIDQRRVLIKRCLDMNDRALRNVVVGLGGKMNGIPREDGFIITVASEVMAILCLAADSSDLKERLGNILVAYNLDGEPVYAKDLKAEGAMAALLQRRDQPQFGADAGRNAGDYARRPVCEHRPWMQFRARDTPGVETGGLLSSLRRGLVPTSAQRNSLTSNAAWRGCARTRLWWLPPPVRSNTTAGSPRRRPGTKTWKP